MIKGPDGSPPVGPAGVDDLSRRPAQLVDMARAVLTGRAAH